jgi:hypothetical protein
MNILEKGVRNTEKNWKFTFKWNTRMNRGLNQISDDDLENIFNCVKVRNYEGDTTDLWSLRKVREVVDITDYGGKPIFNSNEISTPQSLEQRGYGKLLGRWEDGGKIMLETYIWEIEISDKDFLNNMLNQLRDILDYLEIDTETRMNWDTWNRCEFTAEPTIYNGLWSLGQCMGYSIESDRGKNVKKWWFDRKGNK